MHHLMHTARIPGPGDAYRVPPGPSDAYAPAWMKADTITTRTRSGRWTTRAAPCSSPARRAPGKARSSRPVYYTQRVSADANAASVLTDQYTYRTSGNGPSILNIMD